MSTFAIAYCGAIVGMIIGCLIGGWCAGLKHGELEQEIVRLRRLVSLTPR